MYQKLKSKLLKNNQLDFLIEILIATILVSIPLKSFYGSLFVVIFLIFAALYRRKFNMNIVLVLPIILYLVMLLSLFWTTNTKLTTIGLMKEVSFLAVPIAFLFLPKFSKKSCNTIIKYFSFGMVAFASYSFLRGIFRYIESGKKEVFLFHDLVSLDLNAIYIAGFSSLSLFYFIFLKDKKPLDYFGFYIIVIFVILLNSKTVFFIDLILLVWFYVFFSKTNLGVKSITLIFVSTFLLLSVFFSNQIRARLIEEYETAFVDNTIYKFSDPNQKAYNVSLIQAWREKKFEPNYFFPGTAYRVFQVRIFQEMLFEQKNLWITGFGLNASDQAIIKKHQQYKLFKEYNYHNFHNQYVQIFAELGIFGLFIFVIMMLVNLINALKNKDFLHLVFALSMIILFLTESMLCRQRGIVFFITLYCLFNSVETTKEIKKTIP